MVKNLRKKALLGMALAFSSIPVCFAKSPQPSFDSWSPPTQEIKDLLNGRIYALSPDQKNLVVNKDSQLVMVNLQSSETTLVFPLPEMGDIMETIYHGKKNAQFEMGWSDDSRHFLFYGRRPEGVADDTIDNVPWGPIWILTDGTDLVETTLYLEDAEEQTVNFRKGWFLIPSATLNQKTRVSSLHVVDLINEREVDIRQSEGMTDAKIEALLKTSGTSMNVVGDKFSIR